MAATMVTVVHRFTNIDGTAASGVVIFKLSERITNGGVTYDQAVSVHAQLNSTGELSQALPANNDPSTTPQGSNYTVTTIINGATGNEYAITVPYNAATGRVTLGTLLPKQEGSTL